MTKRFREIQKLFEDAEEAMISYLKVNYPIGTKCFIIGQTYQTRYRVVNLIGGPKGIVEVLSLSGGKSQQIEIALVVKSDKD